MNVSEILTSITTLVTIGVAAYSIHLTIKTIKQNEKHNRNTFMPVCNIFINDYETLIGLKINNSGNGPMIIKNVSFFMEDNTLIKNILDILPVERYADFTTEFQGRTVAPGDTVNIFLIDDHKVLKSYKTQIRDILKDITVKVDYTDIYESYIEPKKRKLDFFSRKIS